MRSERLLTLDGTFEELSEDVRLALDVIDAAKRLLEAEHLRESEKSESGRWYPVGHSVVVVLERALDAFEASP